MTVDRETLGQELDSETEKDEGEGGGEGETKSEIELRMEKELKSVNEKLSQNESFARLVAIPEVRQLLAAQQAGKKVKIVLDEDTKESTLSSPPSVVPPEPPQFDEMSNTDLVKWVVENMSKHFDATLTEKLKTVEDRLTGLSKYIGSSEADKITQQIKDISRKNPDFALYEKYLAELYEMFPKASVMELYLIAKNRFGHLEVPDSRLSTEKPTSGPVGSRRERRDNRPLGREDFAKLLDAAMTRVGVKGVDEDEE